MARALATIRTDAAHGRAVTDWLVSGAVLAALWKSQLIARLQTGLAGRITRRWLVTLICAAVFMAAFQAGRLLGVVICASQEWGGPGLVEALAAIPMQTLAGAAGLSLLIGLGHIAPRRGWLTAASLSAVALFAVVLIPPVTLIPQQRADAVASGPAVPPILGFVRRGGLAATRLYVFESQDPVAVDMEGLGSLTHAAVSRAALNAPAPESYAAIGHLLGHYVHQDLWSMAALLSALVAGLLLALWRAPFAGAQAIIDPAALPVLGLVAWAFLLIAIPAFNLFDQAINYRADAYALSLTRDPDALCRWLISAEANDKADPSSLEAILFYDHPPLRARLIQALRWKAEHGAP